jgi:hypothetical protein
MVLQLRQQPLEVTEEVQPAKCSKQPPVLNDILAKRGCKIC